MIEDPLIFSITFATLVFLSAFFSASETAYSSVNVVRLQDLAEHHNKQAKRALHLVERYDLLLSSILVGNNIVNIASASIATVFFTNAMRGSGPTVATVFTTFIVLMFGEITPKSLAKQNAESVAMMFSKPLTFCIALLKPLTFIFDGLKSLITKLVKQKEQESMTESELLKIIDNAVQEGAIDINDKVLMNRVIAFNDHTVEDIITPRVEISAVSVEADYNEIIEMFKETGYSRLPVYNGTTDDIIGVIHIRDFMQELDRNDFNINKVMKPVAYIHGQMKIQHVLDTLQTNQTHMVIIVDEYGGTLGLATMEDVLEQLVGEIWDEHDVRVDDFTLMPNGWYRVDCAAELVKFDDFFDVDVESESTTVAGWIAEELGKVPENYDYFEYEHLQIRVTRVTHNRAETCIVFKNMTQDEAQ